jgi:hypothetical protein
MASSFALFRSLADSFDLGMMNHLRDGLLAQRDFFHHTLRVVAIGGTLVRPSPLLPPAHCLDLAVPPEFMTPPDSIRLLLRRRLVRKAPTVREGSLKQLGHGRSDIGRNRGLDVVCGR